jgi:hypothetical protein
MSKLSKVTTRRAAETPRGGLTRLDDGSFEVTISGPAPRVSTTREATSKRDSVTFRPTVEDRRILDRLGAEGVNASDAVRRGLRLLAQERWLDQARADMIANRDENLNDEPDAW